MNLFAVTSAAMLPLSALSFFTDIQHSMPKKVNKEMAVNFAPIKEIGIQAVGFGYLGIHGDLPDSAIVDWNENLNNLWQQKLNIKNVSRAAQNSADDLVARYEYAKPETMTLAQHIFTLDQDLVDVKQDLDWSGICVKYKLDGKACSLFIRTAYGVNARMLTAYSMTEIMPYMDGIKSREMMDLYFRYAGRNYLDYIPALGDTYLSMGRYQFTSYAVGHDNSGPRSVNQISAFSSKHEVPQSVVNLTGIDSDRAAYYFTTYNLLSLFRKMSDKQLDKFSTFCSNNKEQITEYIATAHHNPKWARKRAISWIDGGCQKQLISYQGKALEIYSTKTATNYNSLG